MGQCPVMIPPEPSKEEYGVHALASNATARSTGVMCRYRQRQDEEDEKMLLLRTQSFLRPHNPDRPMRCILPPDEVLSMISIQAEEFRRRLLQEQQPLQEPPKLVREYPINDRQQQQHRDIHTVWSSTSFDSASSVLAPSEVAMTTVTTVSAATEHVSNLDRYAAPGKAQQQQTKRKTKKIIAIDGKPRMKPNREFSVMENIEEDTPSVASTTSATTASSPTSSHCHNSVSPAGGGGGGMLMDNMDRVRQRFQSRIESTSRMEAGSRFDNNNNASPQLLPRQSTPPLACQLLMGTCLGEVHLHQQRQMPRSHHSAYGDIAASFLEDCTFVLHLKMKAHLVDFYQYHYLPMFPASPTPPGISNITPFPTWKKQKQQASKLSDSSSNINNRKVSASSSSLSSVSSGGGIDFFVGPTVYPIRFYLHESIFMELAVTGSLGLVERQQSSSSLRRNGLPDLAAPPSPTSHLPVDQPQRKSPDHYIVLLHRRSGVPLAVCALKAAVWGPPIVRIYATKQRLLSQRSVASTQQLGLSWADSGDYPLYSWAELVAATSPEDGMMNMRYDVYMAAGSDGRFEPEPSYCASPATPGSSTMMVVGRTEMEEAYTGCAMFSIETKRWDVHRPQQQQQQQQPPIGETSYDGDDDDGDDDDDDNNEDEPFYRLSIASGVDPALMICFAAIIDEIMEKSMRLQCQEHTRVALRRARPT